jgi:hypothetical protein
MKILYVTNHIDIAKASGGFISDYQNDLVFYGLRELFGDDVVDSTQIISLYKEYENKIPSQHLWGGMTAFWLIGDNNIDRTNILQKIEDKYYDLIIYGAINRCKDYYDLVSKVYPPNKVILIDSSDEQDLDPLYKKHLYFKRELVIDHPNLLPISFAIPTSKLTTPNKNKIQEYATCIPGQPETYIFKSEQPYYEDYQKSYYGVTMKKAGWECMRHYEILGNYCMPYFIGLEDCPKNTLANLPKELLIEGRELANNFDTQKYFIILDELFEYTKENLTTKNLANYIINHVTT